MVLPGFVAESSISKEPSTYTSFTVEYVVNNENGNIYPQGLNCIQSCCCKSWPHAAVCTNFTPIWEHTMGYTWCVTAGNPSGISCLEECSGNPV